MLLRCVHAVSNKTIRRDHEAMLHFQALASGADVLCAQGGEGGGHTGDVPTSVLIPGVVDACRGHTSPLHGGPVHVVCGGGIHDGRGLAAALSLGAEAVWVGTRFITAEESDAPR